MITPGHDRWFIIPGPGWLERSLSQRGRVWRPGRVRTNRTRIPDRGSK
jgi:hypothetical protein